MNPRLCQFCVALSIVALCVPLWMSGGPQFALLPIPVLIVCLAVTEYLIGRIAKAVEQSCNLDMQLIQSQKLASIGELSSGIAHEINNPLAIIGQEIEWMRHILGKIEPDAAPGLEDARDSMREIGKQVERCKEITHKLLDLARKKEPLIQDVDINKLIEDMARLVDIEARSKNVQIVRDYGDLPVVRTDAPLLRQVALNLLNNANYAVENGGRIRIATRVTGENSVKIEVVDNGHGIPKENLEKIFDPFFTTKPPGKGTGLGLSICQGIVVRLGGHISVASEVGKGTTFTIHLPLEYKKGRQ